MRTALNVNDNYAGTLDYISPNSRISTRQGNAITGFYWWDFTYPTLATEGATLSRLCQQPVVR